jgi:hypothetical protein
MRRRLRASFRPLCTRCVPLASKMPKKSIVNPSICWVYACSTTKWTILGRLRRRCLFRLVGCRRPPTVADGAVTVTVACNVNLRRCDTRAAPTARGGRRPVLGQEALTWVLDHGLTDSGRQHRAPAATSESLRGRSKGKSRQSTQRSGASNASNSDNGSLADAPGRGCLEFCEALPRPKIKRL